MEFYIAQAISIITALAAIISLQCKNMKGTLIAQIVANFCTAMSFLLLDGLSGAGVCLIAIVHALVMYVYNVKKRKPDLFVTLIFIALYIGCSVLVFKSIFDVFTMFASVCFAISIAQEKSERMRIWSAMSLSSWLTYDVVTMAYGNLIVHIAVLSSGIFAMIRYRKKDA